MLLIAIHQTDTTTINHEGDRSLTEARERNCNWSAVSRCSSHVLDFTFASATFPPACSDADADGDTPADDDDDSSDPFVTADEQKRYKLGCDDRLSEPENARASRNLPMSCKQGQDSITHHTTMASTSPLHDPNSAKVHLSFKNTKLLPPHGREKRNRSQGKGPSCQDTHMEEKASQDGK